MLNDQLKIKSRQPIAIVAGIHTGLAIAAELGSRDQREYTILGQATQLASQLAGRVKYLNNGELPVLISYETLQDAGLLAEENFAAGFRRVVDMGEIAREDGGYFAVRNEGVVWQLIDHVRR